ncbi:MAG: glycosyltransferase family 2 protein, partial [Burkholderiaceae bacterium]|nr:glycosyltransferase family 2 protein [Burkholderiaceae bacterium]
MNGVTETIDGSDGSTARVGEGSDGSDGSDGNSASVAAVIVAYRSDQSRLQALVDGLAPQVQALIVVDNSDSPAGQASVAAAAGGCQLLCTGINEGVARAQNRGIRAALEGGARYVLLSDDDSVPAPDLVARLLEGMRRARSCGPRPAAIGPLAFDERDPANVLVYRDTAFGPRRLERASLRGSLQRVSFLLASGCLIDADALEAVGAMREDLFIDHVDLEWGLRARRGGWELYALADLPMAHRLGDRMLRPRWLGGRALHMHSPLRNYYLVRNTLLLVRGRLMPPLWRVGYLWWLVKLASFCVLFVPPRRE